MALPFFFIDVLKGINNQVVLNEDTSRHITQVLRKQVGDELMLTDGKGTKAVGVIVDDHRKRCAVQIVSEEKEKALTPSITIALSLLKNTTRFEWFLEKATEIGINEIIPLMCNRTEKEKFRHDRLHNILVSALLQSQQSWLPILHEPTDFSSVIKEQQYQHKFIAHCLPDTKTSLPLAASTGTEKVIILIGPEGDFTPVEIDAALQQHFLPVALGQTRLRTETAGIVAATLLRIRS